MGQLYGDLDLSWHLNLDESPVIDQGTIYLNWVECSRDDAKTRQRGQGTFRVPFVTVPQETDRKKPDYTQKNSYHDATNIILSACS